MQNSADAQWLRRAIQEFEGPLVQYATRIMGGLDAARDVVQETFLRLCSQERARVDGHLAEWLFSVCRNRALDIKRRQGRLTVLSEEHAERMPGHSPPPDQLAEDRESATHALKLLHCLPDTQQEVVLLKFQHGLSYKQIAEVTGQSVSNVGFLMHTAIKTLRSRMTTPCRCN